MRLDDHTATFELRVSVCKLLVSLFNQIRESGIMPASATANQTAFIPKVAKPGVALDPNNPSDMRGITMGDVIPKVLGLLIAKRLMHWVVHHKLLSPAQVGFMEGYGCEGHVFTLLESVKSRWRDKQSLCALFVDISKAYDSVSPVALQKVLLHMGIPPLLVKLLGSWSSQRTTRVRLNGQLSDPINMLLGLGQGDILSPLLFNLFTDSMTRYIETLVEYQGIHVRGADTTAGKVGTLNRANGASVNVKELKYADDSVFLAGTPAELTTVAHGVHRWCTAWGLKMSLGQKKTEALHFRYTGKDADTSPDPPPIPIAPGHQHCITWTTSYRYLGLDINSSLDFSGIWEARLAKFRSLTARYFHRSSALRRHSNPALYLQLFRTLVSGSILYLVFLLDPPHNFTAAIETTTKDAALAVLKLPGWTPNATWQTLSRLPPPEATIARERFRFYHRMLRTPFRDSIASRVFRLNGKEHRVLPCATITRHAAGIRFGPVVMTAFVPNDTPSRTRPLQPWPIGNNVRLKKHTAHLKIALPLPPPARDYLNIPFYAARWQRR
jgi:hypothetical protein